MNVVTVSKKAQKQIDRVDAVLRADILVAITGLSLDARPMGYIKMEGKPVRYRVRIRDSWRIIYTIHGTDVTVMDVAPRGGVYR